MAARKAGRGGLPGLRTIAMGFPEAEEGVACKGTALESRAFQARGKTFLFVGADHLRLRLDASVPEAGRIAAAAPDGCSVGSKGWIRLSLGSLPDLPPGVIERWIDESFRLIVHKDLVSRLGARAATKGGSAKARKTKA